MESPKTRAGVLDLFCFDRGTVTVSGITIIRPIALTLILPSLTQKRESKSTPQAKDECQREDAQASLSEGESEGVRF